MIEFDRDQLGPHFADRRTEAAGADRGRTKEMRSRAWMITSSTIFSVIVADLDGPRRRRSGP